MEKSSKSRAVKTKDKGRSTKTMVSLAMLGAISIVLVSVVHIPFPPAPFLEYDPADVPILIGTFAYGPIAGLLLTIIVSIIQGITVSASGGPIGIVMHIFATGACVLVSGWIYGRNKSKKTAVVALAIGAIVQTIAMVIMNLVFTPLFLMTPIEAVIPMLLPIIIPFNLLKSSINCILTFILYKSISHLLRKQ